MCVGHHRHRCGWNTSPLPCSLDWIHSSTLNSFENTNSFGTKSTFAQDLMERSDCRTIRLHITSIDWYNLDKINISATLLTSKGNTPFARNIRTSLKIEMVSDPERDYHHSDACTFFDRARRDSLKQRDNHYIVGKWRGKRLETEHHARSSSVARAAKSQRYQK